MSVRFFFIGIVLLFVVIALTAAPAGQRKGTQQFCVTEPDPKHTVIYNNAVYRRIRADAPLYWLPISYHFSPTIPYEVYVKDRFLPAFVPWYDGVLDTKYVTWRPIDGISNLLFAETTNERANRDPGIRYFDIYLKPSANNKYVIPPFISHFCDLQLPIGRKTFTKDSNGVYTPPLSFDTNDIVWGEGLKPTNLAYYIFSYENRGSPSWNTTVGGGATTTWGTYTLSKNGTNKKYNAVFVGGSAIRYIALIDTDPKSPDANVAYKYSVAEFDFQPQALYASAETLDPTPVTRSNLQLETFQSIGINAWGWWNPECKPAIYLYPEQETDVHVRVAPAGYFTYTDPPYPKEGWKVKAYPDGTIVSGDKKYPYLYYESAIADSAFQKPQYGYVVQYDELPRLFMTILPQMGLSQKETADFKEYWEKALPDAPYYFVGVMDEETIERIEPLTIIPKSDTLIRVRLYFEALKEWKKVNKPILKAPERKGFIVSEWGGLVKTNKDHPFTCSQ